MSRSGWQNESTRLVPAHGCAVEPARAGRGARADCADGADDLGGADDADAIRAFGDVPVDQRAQAVVVDLSVIGHGRHQRNDAANDGFHGGPRNPAILAGRP